MPTSPKRDRWTEADVLALPAGEHDYSSASAAISSQMVRWTNKAIEQYNRVLRDACDPA